MENYNPITKTVLILSIILSLLVGAIGGYFLGEYRTTKTLSNSNFYKSESASNNNESNNEQTSNDAQNDSNIDFSSIQIGNSGYTVDTFYGDDKTKSIVAKLLNTKIPELTWTDSAGTQHSSNELGDEYIVEFFMTDCTYCNSTIPEVDAFREAYPDVKMVSLAFDQGDRTAFNTSGENAFYLSNLNTSSAVVNFTNDLPYVPAFVFVKDGNVQLITFGGSTKDDIKSAMDIAFME